MKINVLGTIYKLTITSNSKKYRDLSKYQGMTYFDIKEIIILQNDFTNQTIRHEVIHAFLYESGLDVCSNKDEAWARNEEMIDWVALQFPKINKVFKKLGCDE